ncbi:MAG TPA: nucleotidyltransferase family protein [Tepidisphaeraceae bacterium]|nr:nucleotidyltransferase family protein [Tepidisphaeraceae bacterium]
MSASVIIPSPRSAVAELIIDCARANLDPSRLDPIRQRLQNGNIDWADLLQTATDHGVIPVVHKAIDRAGAIGLPDEQWSIIRKRARDNTGRNLLLMRELLNLLGSMKAAGLRPLPYKGPLLGMAAYGDLSLRQAGDLDILVPQPDLAKAREIIEAAGYKLRADLATQDEAAHMASPHEYDFVYEHPQTHVDVEIHWEIAGKFFSFQPDPVELWDRGQWKKIGAGDVRLMSDVDLLLILCAHGTKHFWTRLTWICDIAQFVKAHPSLDWPALMKRADEFDARGMVQLAFLLAQRLLNAEIPSLVLDRMRPAIREQAEELDQRLFLTSDQRDAMPKGGRAQLTEGGLLESLMFQCRTRESWGSAFRYFFHRAFSPTVNDRAWLKLPRGLGFIYYFLRPLRLLGKYGPSRPPDASSHSEASH